MARLFMSGAEIDGGAGGNQNTSPDGTRGGTATFTRDTSVFRSGVASYKVDSGAGNNIGSHTLVAVGPVDGRTYWARAYCKVSAAPTADSIIFYIGTATGHGARLRTDGTVELFANGAAQAGTSASITDGAWHRLELKAVATATTTWTAFELLVDGASVSTWSGSVSRGTPNLIIGWCITAPGANMVINFDDVALNDSTGSSNNDYPGAGAVVLLKPTADSAVGTGWTLGTGTAITGNTGKTAVSNTPPVGVADLAAGSDPKQIRNATSNANVNYDATMTTYTAAGVGSSDTINAVQCSVATAAPVTTSAKLGTVGIVSNPAVANVALGATGTAGAFWGGAAAGAYGAGASGWKWSLGTMTDVPAVTKGTAPVMRTTQVTASTRIAMVCGMFIYVDYTPAGGGTTYTKTGNGRENG
jgi:hypothetical protein